MTIHTHTHIYTHIYIKHPSQFQQGFKLSYYVKKFEQDHVLSRKKSGKMMLDVGQGTWEKTLVEDSHQTQKIHPLSIYLSSIGRIFHGSASLNYSDNM